VAELVEAGGLASSGLGAKATGALLLAGVLGLAKADAATVGVVAPALERGLHIGDTGVGFLASLGALTGAVSALPAGGLVDRRSRVTLLALALVGWSLLLGLAGLAAGLVVFALARLASGAVATVARPVAVSLCGDLYHPARRGQALAALDAGPAVGAAACFLLGAAALALGDWRLLFFWLAALGLVTAVISRRLPDPAPSRDVGPGTWETLRVLVGIRTNLVVLLADSLGNFFYAGAASFSVLFFARRYGLAASEVDALAPLFAAGAVAGILVGGRLGDRLARRHGGAQRIVLAFWAQVGAVGLLLGSLLNASVPLAATALFLAVTILGLAGPCLDATRVDIVPSAMRGRAEAARGLLTLASSLLGPSVFGLVAAGFASAGPGLALRDAFLVMLVPLGLSSVILLWARSSYPPDAERAAHAATPEPAGLAERAPR